MNPFISPICFQSSVKATTVLQHGRCPQGRRRQRHGDGTAPTLTHDGRSDGSHVYFKAPVRFHGDWTVTGSEQDIQA